LTALSLIDRGLIRPTVIAMPSDGLRGDGTGYLSLASADYEKWIVEDVVGCVTEVLTCVGRNSQLFVAGLSMGGYGALRLGAKYAQTFSGISAHSAVTRADHLARFAEEPLVGQEGAYQEDLDIVYWMKRNMELLPPVRFDCGTGDHFLKDNRTLHRTLAANNISHEYHEFDGCHDWTYWQRHLEDTLIFFENLRGPIA
jgi:enterochelin esterase-like enzyme